MSHYLRVIKPVCVVLAVSGLAAHDAAAAEPPGPAAVTVRPRLW